ncbi:MAG: aminoglycoside phosphotransferase family protein [Actinomycetota bacterium]|nr:aminoglycoside phosphotransferase family protein [Actinomycetota bacterium]
MGEIGNNRLTAARLNRMLADGGAWPQGSLLSAKLERIGEDHGFGGKVYRVVASTSEGPVTLITKCEEPDQVGRAVAVYQHIGEALAGRIPVLLGHSRNTTLFEDISPATQGDALLEASREQALSLIDLVAGLHAATWESSAEPWVPAHWDMDRWSARIGLAGERYPDEITADLEQRLQALHDEVPTAITAVENGPFSWTHRDVGLDNILWRPDGSPVLLDWSSAAVSNPAFDVTPLLGFSPDAPLTPEETISAYLAALRGRDTRWTETEATQSIVAGLRLLIRGQIGFAGFPEEPTQPRLLAFRATTVRYAEKALEWIDQLETNA